MEQKLNPELFDELKTKEKEYNKLVDVVTNRMDYVLRKICSIFKVKFDWWDWPNGDWESDARGHFSTNLIRNGSIEYHMGGSINDMVAIIKEGEWAFHEGEIPVRFLYEDFEDELKEGIQKYKNLIEELKLKEKQKRLNKSIKQKKLIESVKKKLSKEELKAVKGLL